MKTNQVHLFAKDFGATARRLLTAAFCLAIGSMAGVPILILQERRPIPLLFFGSIIALVMYGFYRVVAQRQVELQVDDIPQNLSQNLLIVRNVSTFGDCSATIFDRESRRLYFYNCYTPKRFLARSLKWHSFSVDQLNCVINEWQFVYISDADGRASVARRSEHFAALMKELEPSVPLDNFRNTIQYVLMSLITVLSGIVGILTGWVMTPDAAPTWCLAANIALSMLTVFALLRLVLCKILIRN